MNFIVTRDQAVWERETFRVTVPDDTPEDEIAEYIDDAISCVGNDGVEDLGLSIVDSVEGIDTVVDFEQEA